MFCIWQEQTQHLTQEKQEKTSSAFSILDLFSDTKRLKVNQPINIIKQTKMQLKRTITDTDNC
jgi:hypothetical protein